jgi:hypothetical protein
VLESGKGGDVLPMTTQAPLGLLALERELAAWKPGRGNEIPPSWTVYSYVVATNRWENADRRAWERAGRPGDFTPAWLAA